MQLTLYCYVTLYIINSLIYTTVKICSDSRSKKALQKNQSASRKRANNKLQDFRKDFDRCEYRFNILSLDKIDKKHA